MHGYGQGNSYEKSHVRFCMVQVQKIDANGGGAAYPRMVRQMLISRSAPQPAIMNTPTGGTTRRRVSYPF